VIERFTRGKSTTTDYSALVNLSNASRMEAIHTFEQLSHRLSQSSLMLPPADRRGEENSKRNHRRKTKKTSSVGHAKHIRSKSAPQLRITPLGPATPEGWVRPKTGRNTSSDSRAFGSSIPKRSRVPKSSSSLAQQPSSLPSLPRPVAPIQAIPSSPPAQRLAPARLCTNKRNSLMSFASDSTKLGEIPEHKWTRPGMLNGGNVQYPLGGGACYPLHPYQEPEKPRSRFMKLFKRS
jgi:hypothetical protein